MAEGARLAGVATATAAPPMAHLPRPNGDWPRPGASDLHKLSPENYPGPKGSNASPRIVSDIPPPVVSDVLGHALASPSTPAAGALVNGLHPASHSNSPVNGGPTGPRQPSGPASRPGSKGNTSRPASRTSTPTAESFPARQAAPVSLRWREPQTVQYSGHNSNGEALENHAPAPYQSNGASPTQYPSDIRSAHETTGPATRTPPIQHGAYPPMAQHPLPLPPPPPPPPPPSSAPQQPAYRAHGYPAQATSKPVIMDPPSVRNRASTTNGTVSGFASPTRDYARDGSKFVDDCTRINFAVQQSVPEAVRRIVRDNWEKCLLGSDFHQAFVLNAAIHHSSASITRRAVADFGNKMVSDCKDEVIRHFNTYDLDAVVDYIISVASDSFLDKCLEKRLLTIEAKPLINALARAERLGYEQSDIIDLKNQNEQVIPHHAFRSTTSSIPVPFPSPTVPSPYYAVPASYQSSAPVPPHPAAEQLVPQQDDRDPQLIVEGKDSKGREVMQCVRCYRTFVYAAAYQHHLEKNVCTRLPPSSGGYRWACDHCGAPFATAGGLQYHAANKVCLTASEASPPSAVAPLPSSQAPGVPQHTDQLPATPEFRARAQKIASVPKATTPTLDSLPAPSPIPGDPYSHLTPESMASMNQELRDAEQKFAGRFQEAERIADPDERRVKLDGLKNSFGTKQSMIRKKYGVRLRERRTKAEIAAEKARMGIGHPESTPSKGMSTPPLAASRGGWTVANVAPANRSPPSYENSHKRRRVDEAGASVTDAPRTDSPEEPPRKFMSISDMTNSSPPRAPAARGPVQPSSARPSYSDHQPLASHLAMQSQSGMSISSVPALVAAAKAVGQVIDDDDSDSEMGDIPATLPRHIKQSLAQSSPK